MNYFCENKEDLADKKTDWIGRKQTARLGQQSVGKRLSERAWLKYPGSPASKKRQNRLKSSALFCLGTRSLFAFIPKSSYRLRASTVRSNLHTILHRLVVVITFEQLSQRLTRFLISYWGFWIQTCYVD